MVVGLSINLFKLSKKLKVVQKIDKGYQKISDEISNIEYALLTQYLSTPLTKEKKAILLENGSIAAAQYTVLKNTIKNDFTQKTLILNNINLLQQATFDPALKSLLSHIKEDLG